MVQREKDQEGVLAMHYFDAFSGIGGFALGIQKANPKAECIGYSEIDKYASSVYERHFPEHKAYGDITAINTNELPGFDILVGGFPCQAFSIAGKRAGFEDTRGTLFFELARLLRNKRPGYCVFENVKGLISHDRGRTFRTIIETLDGIGYDLQWEVLNSKYFGVPQNRERIFIVGNLRGRTRPEVFPVGADDEVSDEKQSQLASAITATEYKGPSKQRGNIIALTEPGKAQSERVYSADGISPTLRTPTGGNSQPLMAAGTRIRRLTPIECERLQGFPDNWTALGKDGEKISDTQRYKMCGNAVTVNVIEAIFTKLFHSILGDHNVFKTNHYRQFGQ